jgi:BirA family biotin operon repressor/biotin-[acetyl-CoA-carboxylase] ligase
MSTCMPDSGRGQREGVRRVGAVSVHVFGVVGSTMTVAREMRSDGEPLPFAVLAREQGEGRGRRDRVFVSPRGGLYLTLGLPPFPNLAESWRAGFAVALSAREAIVASGGPALLFDWPNDLVAGDRKVGGILSELVLDQDGGRSAEAALLVGIGINLGPDPVSVNAEAAGRAASLELPGGDAVETVARGILERAPRLVAACADDAGWRDVLESVRGMSTAVDGRWLRVQRHDGRVVEGWGQDLRDDGALIVRLRSGATEAVRYGEISR